MFLKMFLFFWHSEPHVLISHVLIKKNIRGIRSFPIVAKPGFDQQRSFLNWGIEERPVRREENRHAAAKKNCGWQNPTIWRQARCLKITLVQALKLLFYPENSFFMNWDVKDKKLGKATYTVAVCKFRGGHFLVWFISEGGTAQLSLSLFVLLS